MENNKDGGPAFATAAYSVQDDAIYQQGMSLRDYFAAGAMQGMMVGVGGYINDEKYTPYAKGHCNSEISNRAYTVADAMLVEREK